MGPASWDSSTHTIKLVCTWHSLHLPQTCVSCWFNFHSSSVVSLSTAPWWPLHPPSTERKREGEIANTSHTTYYTHSTPKYCKRSENLGSFSFCFSFVLTKCVVIVSGQNKIKVQFNDSKIVEQEIPGFILNMVRAFTAAIMLFTAGISIQKCQMCPDGSHVQTKKHICLVHSLTKHCAALYINDWTALLYFFLFIISYLFYIL